MGRKDVHTSDYFDDNVRFANFVNGTLNHGKQLVKPDELLGVSKEFLYTKEHSEKKVIADNAKLWKSQGVVFALYSIENLTYVDYAAVIRCMLTEAMGYNRQWKEHNRTHRRRMDLAGSEFMSGIGKNDSFYPVIPIVAYYGTEQKWDAADNLYDFLKIKEDNELKSYINNYKINLFDYHNYEKFEQFNTEVKTLFEFLRYSGDKDGLAHIIKENEERYSHIDAETGKLIKVLTNNRALEEYEKNNNQIVERSEWNMCKAFEDYRLEGKMEGRLEGKLEGRIEGKLEADAKLISIIRKKYNRKMTAKDTADILEIDVKEIYDIYDLFTKYPDENDLSIARLLYKKTA